MIVNKPIKLREIYNIPYGKHRRELFIKWLKDETCTALGQTNGIPVNRRYHLSTSDPDLAYLLKKGILKYYRPVIIFGNHRGNGLKNSTGRITYLVLNG